MSGLFKSTIIPGNRLTDFTQSSASVGGVMMWGFGQYVAPGNIIWAPLPPKEHRKVTRQGKGGVKQETFSYTLSHAAAFGRKTIHGYWWIERNGKIVYSQDPNAPVEDQAYSQKWLQRATLYYGTKTQLPDSTIESYEGSGQVSAFRNVPYIVLEDDDVTDNAGAAPSYRACIIASGVSYGTSPPYPVLVEDEYKVADVDALNALLWEVPAEEFAPIPSIVSGSLREPVQNYDWEDSYEPAPSIQSGALRSIVVNYEDPENEYQPSISIASGELKTIVVNYEDPEHEYQPTISIVSGSLS